MLPSETPAHSRLGELLASFAGIDPPAWALEARVRERAASLSLTPDEYVGRVVEDEAELVRLVELLRVGETRFFRHRAQLEALQKRVLPSLGAPIAAWSAGCATGEEAWTLAMLLSERGLPFSLLATDLSTPALARARDGRYPAAAVTRDVPAPLVKSYFRVLGDERVLNDRLRGLVTFQTLNLLGASYPRELDLILCRNVLIYFDEARREEVVSRLVRALKPGGWLLVGYSETLRDCAELEGEAGALYRKRESAAPRPMPISKSQPIALNRADPSRFTRSTGEREAARGPAAGDDAAAQDAAFARRLSRWPAPGGRAAAAAFARGRRARAAGDDRRSRRRQLSRRRGGARVAARGRGGAGSRAARDASAGAALAGAPSPRAAAAVSDAAQLWHQFLDDARAQIAAVEALAQSPAPTPLALLAAEGAMFALRAGAALLGVEAIARTAGAVERALSDRGPTAFAELRAPLADCARALAAAIATLADADRSGARLEDTSALDEAAAAMGTHAKAAPRPPAPPPPPTTTVAADDSVWVPQVDADMIEPFLEEAAERIEALSQKLLRLETAPSDLELVREIFRDLHTIKGSSAFVGSAPHEPPGARRRGFRRAAARRRARRPIGRSSTHCSARSTACARSCTRRRWSIATAGARVDVNIEAQVARLRAPNAQPPDEPATTNSANATSAQTTQTQPAAQPQESRTHAARRLRQARYAAQSRR